MEGSANAMMVDTTLPRARLLDIRAEWAETNLYAGLSTAKAAQTKTKKKKLTQSGDSTVAGANQTSQLARNIGLLRAAALSEVSAPASPALPAQVGKVQR